jgi:hypothetical protein
MPIGTKTDGQTLSAAEVNTISADIATNTTAIAGKQPLDATLSSLATLTGAGVPYATGTDAFAMRAVGVASTSDLLDRASGDGRYATAASPTFTGVPAVPTATVDTNTTQAASTAFVLAQASSANPTMDGTVAVGTSTRFARADHVHASDTSRAPLASPALTGTPTVPTAAVDTNTTQAASTAFVVAQAAAAAPVMDGAATVGTSTRFARADHVHASDTSRAPLASPTLTGTPAAPTAAVDTNTTQVATTAFVVAQAASAAPVMDGSATVGTSTRFARADHVHASDTSRAPLASPTFTGTPAAPTAATTTNTTQVATTAFVQQEIAAAQVVGVQQFELTTSTALTRATHQGATIILGSGGAITFSATTQANGFAFTFKNRSGSDYTVPTFTGGTRYYSKAAAHTKVVNGGDATFEVLTRGATMYVEIIGDTAA